MTKQEVIESPEAAVNASGSIVSSNTGSESSKTVGKRSLDIVRRSSTKRELMTTGAVARLDIALTGVGTYTRIRPDIG